MVIGFGFLVPDVSFNEAYISFLWVHPDWQRSGVGTFMLYHLIQVRGGEIACVVSQCSLQGNFALRKFRFAGTSPDHALRSNRTSEAFQAPKGLSCFEFVALKVREYEISLRKCSGAHLAGRIACVAVDSRKSAGIVARRRSV